MLSLKDLCARSIAHNLDKLTTKCSDCAECKLIWRNITFIGARDADRILEELTTLAILRPEHFNLFSPRFVNLKSVDLRLNSRHVQSPSFMHEFSLTSLTIRKLNKNHSLRVILISLSEGTHEALMSLHVSHASVMINDLILLDTFANLQSLSLSDTTLTSVHLDVLVEKVPQLTWLDISKTEVTDISPLRKYGVNLEGLIMRNIELHFKNIESHVLLTLADLKGLQHLDVSYSKYTNTVRPSVFESRLCTSEYLPDLKHFEMNGNPFMATADEIK